MAGTDDLQGQSDILAQMQKSMAGLQESITGLNDGTNSLTDAMSGLVDQMGGFDDASSKMSEMTEGIQEGSEATTSMTDAMQKMAGQTKKQNKQVDQGTKGIKKYVAAGMGLALIKGMWDSMAAGLKSVISLVGSLVTSATNMVKGVFKAWAGTWSALGKQAKEMHRLGMEVARAWEDVRGVFGDLATGEGKMVADTIRDVQSSGDFANATGLSLFTTFGNLKDIMKVVSKVFEEAGLHAKRIGEAFKGNTAELLILSKAYGLTGETIGIMTQRNQAMGMSAKEASDQFNVMAIGLKRKMGVNLKAVGKNFNELAKDVGNFGAMTQKELLATAAYADKLKVSVSSLQGMFKKFDNFETAAAGAGKLAEAFGMNVDAMDLLNAESPAEQMDMMRTAFAETGQSVQDLNRHQQAYLAENMGIDVKDLANMMDPSNMDISYDDMIAAAEDAEKEMSPAEAMKEAAAEIKKAFKEIEQSSTTFFGRFKDGFLHGLKHTKPYREFFQFLENALRQVHGIGRDLAKQLFGRGGVFHGDAMGFVAKWKDYLKEIVNFFKDLSGNIVQFAKDMKSGADPSVAVQGFLDRLIESAQKFFNSDAVVAWQKMWAGFVKMAAKIMERVLVGIIHWVADKLKNIATSLGDDNGVMSAWAGAFMQLWESLKLVMVELWKILGPPLLEGILKLWEWAKPKLIVISAAIFKVVLMRAIITAAAGAFAGAALKAVISGFTGMLAKATAAGGAGKLGKSPIKGLGKFADDANKTKTNWAAAIPKMIAIAAFVALGIVGFLVAFFVILEMIKGHDPKDVLLAAGVMVAMGVALAGLGIAGKAAEAVSMKGLGKLALMYLMFVGAMYGLGQISLIMIDIVNEAAPKLPKVDVALHFFGFMGICMAAGAAALAIAVVAAKFANPQTVLGLGLLGLAMIGLGGVAWVLGKMFESINPGTLKQVAPIMEALAKLMVVVMLAIPVAGVLGAMLMSFPFGTAGVALIAAGFVVLGTLASVMVDSLMPVIRKIAAIKITDPASFEMIVVAIAAIITAVSAFMGNIGAIMAAADPGIAGMLTKGSSSMEENLKAMTEMIGKVLDPLLGDNGIAMKLIDLAKGATIDKSNVAAIMGIAAVLNAIANIMSALAPSPKQLEIIEQANDFWNSGKKQKTMQAMLRAQRASQQFAVRFMNNAKVMIVAIIEASKGATPASAKVIEAVGGILGTIVDIMNAIKPSDKEMKLAKQANKFWGGSNARKTMRMMHKNMKMQAKTIAPMIAGLGDAAVKIIGALGPMFKIIGDLKIDPKILEAVGKIIASVMAAVGSMGQMVGPAMAAMGGSLETNLVGDSKSKQLADGMSGFGTMIGAIGTAMGDMMPKMTTFIQTIMTEARLIRDPKGMKEKMEVIASAMGIIGSMLEPMSKVMDIIQKAGLESGSDWINTMKLMFGPWGGFQDGILGELFAKAGSGIAILMTHIMTATKGITDPKAMKAKMEIVVMAMEAVGKSIDMVSKVMDIIQKAGLESGSDWINTMKLMFGPWGGFDNGIMVEIFAKAGNGIQLLMQYVEIAMKYVKNPKTMLVQMQVVVAAMEAVGQTIDMVSKVMGIIQKAGLESGSDWINTMKLMFGPWGGFDNGIIGAIFSSVGKGLKDFMPMVTEIMADMKESPSRMKGKMEVIILALEAVGKMTDAIGSVIGMMPDGSIMQGSRLDILFHNLRAIMPVITENMGFLVDGIIDIVKPKGDSKITEIWKYRHTIKELPNIFDAITAFAASLTALKGVGGGDIAGIKPLIIAFGAVFNDPVAIEALRGALSNIANLPVYTYKQTAKAVKNFSEMIDSSLIPLGESIDTWRRTPGSVSDVNRMGLWIGGSGDDIGFYGLLDILTSAIVPDLSNIFKQIELFSDAVYSALIPVGLAISDWKKSPGSLAQIKDMAIWISGGKETYGLADIIIALRDMPVINLSSITAGIIGIEVFLRKALIPMGTSLSAATKQFGVKEGTKWWQKEIAGGGTMDVEALAQGLSIILRSFANFDRLIGVSPTELNASVGTLFAYADRFAAIAKSLDTIKHALFQTVKFAKMDVTPEVIVQEAALKIDELSKAFASLDELVVDSTMAKVAEALVGGEAVTVDHKGLQINIKFNVTMDAKELATALGDEHGSWFQLNENRENPMAQAEFE